MTKLSYKDATKKRAIQDSILSKVTNKSIVGLGGPDVDDYINILEKKGFKNIHIYENSLSILSEQIGKFKYNLIYGNILHDLKRNAFYDLDFCFTIKSLSDDDLKEIAKIPSYSITFSLRGAKLTDTISRFSKYCGNQQYKTYRDSSSMVVFYKN